MLDSEKAAEAFDKADAALNKIIFGSTVEAERNKAIAAQEKLALDFTAEAIKSVNGRTALFQTFIDAMEGVIDSIGRDSPLAGVKQLQSVVDLGRELLSEEEEGP